MEKNFLPMGLGVGTQILERWNVTKILGSSPISVIVSARDSAREFPERAIKITAPFHPIDPLFAIDPNSKDPFSHELELATLVDHPNVARVYQTGKTAQGNYFAISELVNGVSLDLLLTPRVNVGLTPTEAHHILYWTARSIAAAHAKNAIHRNIRSTKVYITESGQVKVADWGMGCRTFTKSTLGPPIEFPADICAVAPEELDGRPADWRTDVYSFGILAYEILTGRKPFSGQTQDDIANQILHQPLPDPTKFRKGLPEYLLTLLERCTEKRAAMRFQTMFEVVNLLEPNCITDEQVSCRSFKEALQAYNETGEVAPRAESRIPVTLREQFKVTPTMLAVVGVAILALALLVNSALDTRETLDGITKQGAEIRKQTESQLKTMLNSR